MLIEIHTPFEKEHVCEKGLQKKSDWTFGKTHSD